MKCWSQARKTSELALLGLCGLAQNKWDCSSDRIKRGTNMAEIANTKESESSIIITT